MAAAALAPPARADDLSFTIAPARAPRLGSSRPAPPVPPGFVGASIDYCSIDRYVAGPAAASVLAHLLGALAPQGPILRIGGEGPLEPCPGGVQHPLHRTEGAIRTITAATGARLILGINFAAGRPLWARWDMSTLLRGIEPVTGARDRPAPQPGPIAAFEIGNEPDLYPRYGSSATAPAQLTLEFRSYLSDFLRWSRLVRRLGHARGVGTAGPSLGRYGTPWIAGPDLANFEALVDGPARPRYVTFHSYPLIGQWPCPAIQCPQLANLLADSSSHGIAEAVAPYVALLPPGTLLRVDEMNSVSGGGRRGISDTFGSALWALDAMFELASAGVNGVNVHTFPGAPYELFSHPGAGPWFVRPEYYGLLAFARAAPAGSVLLRTAPALAAGVKVWATRGPDGVIRVTIINKDAVTHDVTLSGRALRGAARAHLQWLDAPAVPTAPAAGACPAAFAATDLCATGGVSLGGMSFGHEGSHGADATSTGLLPARACPRGDAAHPCTLAIGPGGTSLAMPPGGAVLMTLAGPRRKPSIRPSPPKR